MEFRNHHVWVKQRLAEFSGRPLAIAFLILVVLVLVPLILLVAAIGISIGIVVTLVRVLLGMLGLGRAPRMIQRVGDPNATVIDVEVTRSETKP